MPAFQLLHPLQLSDGHVVPLVDAGDVFAQAGQLVVEGRKNHVLHLLHAQGQHLGHQNGAVAVYGQAGHLICLPVDQAAALEVRAGHDGPAVGDGVGHSAAPEGGVEAVVGVA